MWSLFTKPLMTVVLATFFFVTGLVTSVQATSFNWSYEFGDMTTASGMLEGEIDPGDSNLVHVTGIMGVWTGDPLWEVNTISGIGRVTFDGTFLDMFAKGPMNTQIDLRRIKPVFDLDVAFIVGRNGGIVILDQPFVSERWSLTRKTDPIPEPSTIILFGTGMLGLLAWARRKKTLASS